MLHIDILTVLPELLESPFNHSIIKRGKEKGLVEIEIHDLRDYSTDKHRKVDNYAFGGGAGMVMQIEPIDRAITALKAKRKYDTIIYTSPDGQCFDQQKANQLSTFKNILILCGHYKGIDHRIREHFISEEISIGDFVLTGGEIAAIAITDAVVRLVPGVLSDETSALSDSFQDNLLAPPVYSRPEVYKGWKVPDVLLSGNHKAIDDWRLEHSLERTKMLRPDLLDED